MSGIRLYKDTKETVKYSFVDKSKGNELYTRSKLKRLGFITMKFGDRLFVEDKENKKQFELEPHIVPYNQMVL